MSRMPQHLLFLGGAVGALAFLGCEPVTSAPGDGASACPMWNDTPPPPSDPPNADPPTRTVDVAACAGGLSQADIDLNLKLADKVEADFREQPACGVLAQNYSYSLSHWFAAAACGDLSRPSGFIYAGSGYYQVGGLMGMQAKLAKDTSFGKAGDDILFDLFDQGSYGAGPLTIKAMLSADTSWSTDSNEISVHLKGTIDITQEEPKVEGLELWGIPADGKPIRKQQEELARTIGESVAFTAQINADEVTSTGGVKYRFDIPETTVGDTYAGKPIKFQLVDIVATDTALNQSTSLVSYDVSFIPASHGPMKGSFIVRVDGGKFPYYAKFTYPNRTSADILISCSQPPP